MAQQTLCFQCAESPWMCELIFPPSHEGAQEGTTIIERLGGVAGRESIVLEGVGLRWRGPSCNPTTCSTAAAATCAGAVGGCAA